MDPGPVLDGTALERLERVGGNDLVVEMIGLFLEHSPERIAAARVGAHARDLVAVYRAAHSLKSTAATLGAGSVQAAAQSLERQASMGDASAIPPLLDELERCYQGARERLIAERDRRGSADEPRGAV